jgi:hypothetical protein
MDEQVNTRPTAASGQVDLKVVNSVEELLELSRRKSGKLRAWSDMSRPGMIELIAEAGELRRARCQELFGTEALDQITMIHFPLRVERVEEVKDRQRKRPRGPYYASEEEATLRIKGNPN